MSSIERVETALTEEVSPPDRGLCPSHDDANPSLSVSEVAADPSSSTATQAAPQRTSSHLT